MIVNNTNSVIWQQNNSEAMSTNKIALDLLQRILDISIADTSLSAATREAIHESVETAITHLAQEAPSKGVLIRALDAVSSVGSISELIARFLDLF